MSIGHTWYKCECDCSGCAFCDGGLASCTVCGGAEGTLTTECVGFNLPEAVLLDLVYTGPWDFWDGQWILMRHEVQ